MSNDLSQTVQGKDASEIEAVAKAAVLAYYGTLDGVEWEISTNALVTVGGNVLGYVGRVSASRDTP